MGETLFHNIPHPTDDQYKAFVVHLTDVHSWYKHLPLMEGGEFIVFLDIDAGKNYPSLHPKLPLGINKMTI
jgi:hypothetical protein